MKQRDNWHLTDTVKHDLGRGDPFAAAVRGTRMPMVITDPTKPDNPIIFCNEAFQTLTGYERDEILGHNCRFLQGPATDRASIAKVRAAIAADENIAIDLLNYRKDGTTFWNALFLSPVRNDDGITQFFFASQFDVSDRVEAQMTISQQKAEVEREVERRTADLTAALEAKSILLHEVDHRVKNNLMMIGSLLRLQARTVADPAIGAKLDSMLERVDALSTVHRRLYQSGDVTRFDIGAFTETLVADVIGASGRTDVVIETDVDEIDVPSAAASALGLVINEIVTNAIKHAFADGRSGTLSVSAKRHGAQAIIIVRDDGPGMAIDAPTDGLGRVLIARLSRQVRAVAAWTSASTGTQVSLTFAVEE